MRREEIIGGELYFTENITGLVGGVIALLFRYTEIINGNKHLNIANKLNDSEKPKGYIYCRCSAFTVCVKSSANIFIYR